MFAGCDICTRSALKVTLAGLLTPVLAVTGLSLAPSARADLVDMLRNAVAQARTEGACGPLRPDPVADQVAAIVNKSYTSWLDHTATSPPITDALPGLKELGYRGNKGKFLGGVSKKSDADAIKALVLEGYAAIPDCSYTDYGVNMVQDEASGYTLAAVVLGGP